MDTANAHEIGICEFESQHECIFLLISVAESVRTRGRKVQLFFRSAVPASRQKLVGVNREEMGRSLETIREMSSSLIGPIGEK